MRWIKVACAALNQIPLDWEGNVSRIRAAIEAARSENVSVLCFPELSITGYGCEDAFLSSGIQRTALQCLEEISQDCAGLAVAVGTPLFINQALFNTACLIADGRICGLVAKQFLAREGVHYEPRWFRPWPAGKVVDATLLHQSVPVGDMLFELGDIRLGFEICEDAWAVKRPGTRLAAAGVDLILNPSASHFAFGKFEVRKRFVLEGSRAFGACYLYSNLVGNESGRMIYDGGSLIASNGRLVAQGPRFSFGEWRLTTALIDLDEVQLNRARSAEAEPDGANLPLRIQVPFTLPRVKPQLASSAVAAWEGSSYVKEEEFSRAVALGLFDYMRKSRSRGFVVSLSGGADSSAITCLVRIMLDLALKELGLEELRKRLSYIPGIAACDAPGQIMPLLLMCVYQSTANSSAVTRAAARAVSQAVGAQFVELDVEHLVRAYVKLGETAQARELTWEQDDIALQNIQARVRGPSVWLLANLQQALLLATSNRSEAAVGYTTMDGDTCGGLSPIAGIDKAFLRSWLRWLETRGPEGVGAVPAVGQVNAQEPTAELRPLGKKQTDEGDLMPYDVLDAVERYAIRDKKLPAEVLALVEAKFAQYDPAALREWVERFFRLWCRNQWKRERYAPCFHLDDENLDPKTWCRFPILSSGFERELRQMKA